MPRDTVTNQSVHNRGASIVAWMLVSAPLHLGWEVVHVRWYTLWLEPRATIVYSVLHCTLGDIVISAGSFALATLVSRRWDWPWYRPGPGLAVMLAAGLAYTAVSEWVNVYYLQRWAYLPDMPLIAGIGVSPLLQWIVVPLATFGIYRVWANR